MRVSCNAWPPCSPLQGRCRGFESLCAHDEPAGQRLFSAGGRECRVEAGSRVGSKCRSPLTLSAATTLPDYAEWLASVELDGLGPALTPPARRPLLRHDRQAISGARRPRPHRALTPRRGRHRDRAARSSQHSPTSTRPPSPAIGPAPAPRADRRPRQVCLGQMGCVQPICEGVDAGVSTLASAARMVPPCGKCPPGRTFAMASRMVTPLGKLPPGREFDGAMP